MSNAELAAEETAILKSEYRAWIITRNAIWQHFWDEHFILLTDEDVSKMIDIVSQEYELSPIIQCPTNQPKKVAVGTTQY
jgi:hypothetical protein